MKHTHYHLIGIGGIGMSALAHMLLQRGMKVSGSDLKETLITQKLRSYGAEIFIGHDASHIRSEQIVVYSSAITQDNCEIQQAKALECLVWSRADLLKWLTQKSKNLVVVGTHGKTTTTALVTHILYTAGFDPSYIIGGSSNSFSINGSNGKGAYCVVEGDESDASFESVPPYGAIVTGIEDDHLNFWKSKEALYHSMVSYMLQVQNPKLLFWYAEDPFLSTVCSKGVSYGLSRHAHIRAFNIQMEKDHMVFDIDDGSVVYRKLCLNMLGIHNVLNATAAFALARALGVPEAAIRLSFTSFTGVKKRFELLKEVDDIAVYFDYAHHPTEIAFSLATFNKLPNAGRKFVVFQPHRYSRTYQLMGDFANVLSEQSNLILTDLYAMHETPIAGVNAAALLRFVKRRGNEQAQYVKQLALVEYLHGQIKPKDAVLFLGAGDIYDTACQYIDTKYVVAT